MTADQIATLRITADKAKLSPNDYDEGCLLHEALDAIEDVEGVEGFRDAVEAQCVELEDIAEELGDDGLILRKRIEGVCERLRKAV